MNAVTHLHALVGWDFIKLVAAKLGVKLSNEHLLHIKRWTTEEEKSSAAARDTQHRIKTATHRSQTVRFKTNQQRNWDGMNSNKKAKASVPAHTEGYQPLAHPAWTCECFFTEAAAPATQTESQAPQSQPAAAAAAAAAPKTKRYLHCELCRSSFLATGWKAHASGKKHVDAWDSRAASSAASSGRASAGSVETQCHCTP